MLLLLKNSIVLPTLFSFLFIGLYSAEADTQIDSIQGDWDSRQANIPSANVQWHEDRMYFAGCFPSFKSDKVCPAEDQSGTVVVRLNCLLDDFRVEMEGIQYSGRTESIGYSTRILSFSKKLDKSFYKVRMPNSEMLNLDNCPLGYNAKNEHSSNASDPYLIPIMLFIRPASTEFFGTPITEYEVSGKEGVIGDTDCVIVRPINSSGPYVREYWLDPKRSFLVRRIVALTLGKKDLQIDIEYQKDEVLGWVPSTWTTLAFSGSNLIWEAKARVEKYNYDAKITAVDTGFVFPPGTLIQDYETEERYIINAKGGKRIITKNENASDVPYKILLSTESGEGASVLNGTTSSWSTKTFLWINVAIVSILFVALVVKRMRVSNFDE